MRSMCRRCDVSRRWPVNELETMPFAFSIAGIDLRMLLKKLKPAFPRTKKTVAASVGQFIVTSEGKLSVRIPGAEAFTVCRANSDFTAELPLREIIGLQHELIRDSEQVQFAFAPGQMRFRSATFSGGAIRVWKAGEHADPLPESADPMQTVIGFPLLTAYHTLRQYPDESFAGNPVLGPQKVQIHSILTRAAKLLGPLGIDRTRLERLLDSMKD
jgi:hypothetical protein